MALVRVWVPALLGAGLSLGLIGCDRNIEPYRPGEEARQPDLGRIFPGASSTPGAPGEVAANGQADGEAEGVAEGEAEGVAEGRTARAALPPSRSEAGGAWPEVRAAGAEPIRGRVELAPGLERAQPAGGVLFVIARREGAAGGPPLAVLRIPAPSFPLDFSIGPENVMIPSMRFEGSISLIARLDADGNAMTRGDGDVSSPVEAPLRPGASGVRLLLSERG